MRFTEAQRAKGANSGVRVSNSSRGFLSRQFQIDACKISQIQSMKFSQYHHERSFELSLFCRQFFLSSTQRVRMTTCA